MTTFNKTTPILDKNYDAGDSYLVELVQRAASEQSDYVQRAFSDWLN